MYVPETFKHYMLSRPMPVHMAGFRSDTATLQQQGWQLSVDQGRNRYGQVELNLAMKHEGIAQYAMCYPLEIDIEHMQHIKNVEFFVMCISPTITARVLPSFSATSYKPIDARPEFIDYSTTRFEDISMFKPVNVGEDFEIYLNKKDENEIMDLLLSKQDSKQQEIRENRRRQAWKDVNDSASSVHEGINPVTDIRSQIILVG